MSRTRFCMVAWALIGLAGRAGAEAAAAAAPDRFDVLEFRVLGNHVLPTAAVERAVYPFLGTGRDIETVKRAAEALEKAYKDAGFGTVFVDVPEQDVDDGVVRLKVTEGRLDRVRVRGEQYFSARQIRAALPSLVPGQTPNLPSLQQELTALNERTADRAVTPVLKAGRAPGSVDIDLAVKDDLPLHGSVETDNRHTADTTPNRATVSLSYDNLWQRQHSLSLEYQTAPADTKSASVVSASYAARPEGANGIATFSYIHTSSNVPALGTLGVLGKGSIYGAHWLEALMNQAGSQQSVTFGVDYKDVLTLVFPNAQGGSPAAGVSSPVRYLNWSVGYSGAWQRPANSFAAGALVGFGVRNLVNTTDEFANARYDGAPGYFYLRLSGQATQALPGGFGLLARASGQWADLPLVNNEQFAVGGADTVRGYLEAETLGDDGLAGTLEVHTPALGPRFGATLGSLYGLVFVDGGVATILDPLPAQAYHVRLWSAGVGLRFLGSGGVGGALDLAVPQVAGPRTPRGEGHVGFNFRYSF